MHDVVNRWFEAQQGTNRKTSPFATVECKGFPTESACFW